MFAKVLVANRGEIAVRVIRALRERGIGSVAVFSEVDRASAHVRLADEAVAIGPAPASESYLHIPRIVAAARERGAQAIHPGYGFLSENARFAEACRDAGLVFIGPSPESIRAMGDKIQARRLARAAGVPVVPGADEPVPDAAQARDLAARFGYPVLLKAAAGGGGKGMRRVDAEADIEAAFRDAASEAERAFGDGSMYVEKLIERPRHIEIQVFGDHHGNLIHLGERECSIQRRHQKLLEECPSPLSAQRPELRHQMGEAAVRVARAGGYYNAGTVEFLVDAEGDFYFLEMNARLQVEHPVTELVTGLDLVHLQLDVAAGLPLPMRQQDIAWRGAAIECRIYAEDTDNHFFPSPGTITSLAEPSGPGVRLDSGVYRGWTVPLDYDPLLAKFCVWGPTRAKAIASAARALGEYHIAGPRTNLSFFRRLLDDERFRAGELHTGFLDGFFARQTSADAHGDARAVAALVAALEATCPAAVPARPARPAGGRWRLDGRSEQFR